MQAWNFRKPIIVEQSGIAQITVPFEQGMSNDFSDVRFVGFDEEALLDYKRVSFNAGQDAVFAVDALAPNMYLYFGNESATYDSTWTPPISVIEEITHEKGYVKNTNNPVIPLGSGTDWDRHFIQGVAVIEEVGTLYAFYGGMDGSGANPRLEGEIGLATSTDGGETFTKQGRVIERTASPSPALGMSPFSIKKIGSTYYLFMSTFFPTVPQYKLCYMTSTDMLNWGGFTYLNNLDSACHAPCVIDDPQDDTKLILYYGDMTSTARIRRSTMPKSDPSDCSAPTTALAVSGVNTLYPSVRYKGDHYEMFFAKQLSGGGYSTYKTVSKDGLTFYDSQMRPVPNGASGQWDFAYITSPHIYGDKLFYSARITNNSGDGYKGIGVAKLDDVGGVVDWGWQPFAGAGVSSTAKDGDFGGTLTLNKSHLLALSKGSNKTYELWIYDNMSTATNYQNTFRLVENLADPALLVGVWRTTSSSKYVYRKTGGTWTATSIDRTLGWHKLSFDVKDSGVDIKIDDVLIDTDAAFNVANFIATGVYTHEAGTAFFDNYRVLGISEGVEVQVGTEINPN